MEMLLSIIIPFYNVEPWIARCLDSCFDQGLTESDFEIICVDDGSLDGSLAIVKQYARSHANIVILQQTNAGQGAARNFGLRMARGKYVWFVDSDDWLQPNSARDLLNILDTHHLDVLCFLLQYVEVDGRVHPYGFHTCVSNEIMRGTDYIVAVDRPASVCTSIYNRFYLLKNRINFIEGIKREDEDYTVRAHCMARRIELVEKVAYNYYQRAGSTVRSPATSKTAYDLLAVSDSLYFFAKNKVEVHSAAYYSIMNHASFIFSQALAYYADGKPSVSDYKQKPYYPLILNSQLSIREKWKYRLINYSIPFYLYLYFIKKHKHMTHFFKYRNAGS